MPRISKKRFISPNFSLYNNRGEYDNGADYFTGDLVYYAGDWWHCYDSAHLSPGYPPPSRPENFVQVTFTNKIISKTTEVKNLAKEVDILNFEKKQIESSTQIIDPFFDNVSLYLQMDGQNNSTNFIDSSNNNYTVTPNGEVKISTTQSKYGISAGYFNGLNGNYLDAPIPSDFFNEDFTIEAWVWLADTTSVGKSLFNTYPHNLLGVSLHRENTKRSSVAVGNGNSWTNSLTPEDAELSPNEWNHIAIVGDLNGTTLFHNGVNIGNINTKPQGSASYIRIGQITWPGGFNNENFNGYIDDFKLTKGIARYKSSFTASKNSSAILKVKEKIDEKVEKIEKKTIKVEEKINVKIAKEIEKKIEKEFISSSLPVPAPIPGQTIAIDPNVINNFSFSNLESISFNSSPYYSLWSVRSFSTTDSRWDGSLSLVFGISVSNSYFSNRFVLFNGQEALNWINNYGAFEVTDTRGYYGNTLVRNKNGNIIGGKFRSNWKKYKRSSGWCLYDALFDIMYYNDYVSNKIPIKKWYKAGILYKTQIELKTRVGSFPQDSGLGLGLGLELIDSFLGGSAGSGSSGAGLGLGLIDSFLGGSAGSGSSGAGLGLGLIDQFLLGPLFGPNNVGGNPLNWNGDSILYTNPGHGGPVMVLDKNLEKYFIDPNLIGLGNSNPNGTTLQNNINYNSYNLPITGWTNSNGDPSQFILTTIPVEEWVVIFGTANGWYNNVYWINNVKTTLNNSGNGFWNNQYYESGQQSQNDPYQSATFGPDQINT